MRRMYRRVTRSELQFKRLQHGDQKQVYAGLLWIAKARGRKVGWAAWKFKAIYGDWPPFSHRDVEPLQPPSDLLTWLERERRNYGQRMKRQEVKEAEARKNASTASLGRIDAILAELEANPLVHDPCCQEDTDGESLDIVARLCKRGDGRSTAGEQGP